MLELVVSKANVSTESLTTSKQLISLLCRSINRDMISNIFTYLSIDDDHLSLLNTCRLLYHISHQRQSRSQLVPHRSPSSFIGIGPSQIDPPSSHETVGSLPSTNHHALLDRIEMVSKRRLACHIIITSSITNGEAIIRERWPRRSAAHWRAFS
jgi:hypothetical protein